MIGRMRPIVGAGGWRFLLVLVLAAVIATAGTTAAPADALPTAPTPAYCGGPPPPPEGPTGGFVPFGPGILRDPWIPGVPPTPPFEVAPTAPYLPPPYSPSALERSSPLQPAGANDALATARTVRAVPLPTLLQNPFPWPMPGGATAINYEANNSIRAGGTVPDPHGGVGTEYFLEIMNNRITVYDKYTGKRFVNTEQYPTHDEPLSMFFAIDPKNPATHITELLSDPRAIKDPISHRWIASVLADQPVVDALGNRKHNFYLAVSETDDARKKWYTHMPFEVPLRAGEAAADYPILGVDGGSIILSVFILRNEPKPAHVVGTRVYVFSKMRVFAGDFSCVDEFPKAGEPELPVFLTPPIVRGGANETYFVAPDIRAPGNPSTRLRMYVGRNLGATGSATLTPLRDVSNVPPYVMPADADQGCSGGALDALDGRFTDASTQVGQWLWQVHTVSRNDSDRTPRPRFYEIDTAGVTETTAARLRRTGQLFASEASHDFNASIVADDEDTFGLGSVAFVNWSSTHPSTVDCINHDYSYPEIRYDAIRPEETATEVLQIPGARLPNPWDPNIFPQDPNNRPKGGIVTTGRWGDYSSITIDPTADQTSPISPPCRHRAWLVNELGAGTQWRSQWAAIGVCF